MRIINSELQTLRERHPNRDDVVLHLERVGQRPDPHLAEFVLGIGIDQRHLFSPP